MGDVPQFEEHNVRGDGDCFLHALRCALGDDRLRSAFGAVTPAAIRRWLVGQARRSSSVYRTVLSGCWDSSSADEAPGHVPESPIIGVVNKHRFTTLDAAVGSAAFEAAVTDRSYYMTHYEIHALNAAILAATSPRVAVLTPDWREGRTTDVLTAAMDLALRLSIGTFGRRSLYVVLPNVGGHYRYLTYSGSRGSSSAALIPAGDIGHVGSSAIAVVDENRSPRCENGERVYDVVGISGESDANAALARMVKGKSNAEVNRLISGHRNKPSADQVRRPASAPRNARGASSASSDAVSKRPPTRAAATKGPSILDNIPTKSISARDRAAVKAQELLNADSARRLLDGDLARALAGKTNAESDEILKRYSTPRPPSAAKPAGSARRPQGTAAEGRTDVAVPRTSRMRGALTAAKQMNASIGTSTAAKQMNADAAAARRYQTLLDARHAQSVADSELARSLNNKTNANAAKVVSARASSAPRTRASGGGKKRKTRGKQPT